MSWFPNNPVLRMLTPQDTCRKLEIYPVQLSQEAICIDLSGALPPVEGWGRAGGCSWAARRMPLHAGGCLCLPVRRPVHIASRR